MATVSPPRASRLASGPVLVTWPDFPTEGDGCGALLTAAGLTLRTEPKLSARTAEEVCLLADGAVAAIVSTDPFDKRVFDACPTLRVIARVGVGVDSIDLDAATAAGVAVTTTPGLNESTTADHAVALMLAVVRRVPEHDAAVRRGEWNRTGHHIPGDLTGKTIGLIGYGRIGKLVARRLEGFRVRVLVHDPNEQAFPPAQDETLDRLLADSHIVSIHTPLEPATRGLIGAREFSLMREDAIFINTARGGVADEQALVRALESGVIRGAALDVYETEPPTNQRLLELPNVVLTPHTGGISDQSVNAMLQSAARSVLAVLRGEMPDGLVNPQALDASTLGLRTHVDDGASVDGHREPPEAAA